MKNDSFDKYAALHAAEKPPTDAGVPDDVDNPSEGALFPTTRPVPSSPASTEKPERKFDGSVSVLGGLILILMPSPLLMFYVPVFVVIAALSAGVLSLQAWYFVKNDGKQGGWGLGLGVAALIITSIHFMARVAPYLD